MQSFLDNDTFGSDDLGDTHGEAGKSGVNGDCFGR